MINASTLIARRVSPWFERAKQVEGVKTGAELGAIMGLSAPQVSRASRGKGPDEHVLALCDRGGINPEERKEIAYLLTGVWPVGGGS
jgi:hypothetical protein